MTNLKDIITSERNKISQMDKDQKWDYFKTYYLAKTIAAVIVLVLFVWFLKDTFFQKKIANAGCVYGIEISEEQRQMLTEGYLNYYDYNRGKYAAYISTDNMFEGTEQRMDAKAHEMALFAQIAAGEVFYLILDKENLYMMANGGIYLPLNEAFEDNLPEDIADSVVYLKDPESLAEYPAAINIGDAGILNEGEDAFLVFTVGIPDKEYPERFLNYLLNM